MKRHTITLKDVNDYLDREVWGRVASSYGNDGASKSFECNRSGQFRVTDHGAVVYLGENEVAAINAYNEAP
jgi:hypothetical protein